MVDLEVNEQFESPRLVVLWMEGPNEHVAYSLVPTDGNKGWQVSFSRLIQTTSGEQVEPAPMSEPVEEITPFPGGTLGAIRPDGAKAFKNHRSL